MMPNKFIRGCVMQYCIILGSHDAVLIFIYLHECKTGS